MILSIASQKGGTGKTTTSLSVAAGAVRVGKRVLLVDMDSQANASKVLLPHYLEIPNTETVYRTIISRETLPIHPTSLDGLDIAPSHILLSEADMELTTAMDHREARLKYQIARVADQYDHVIIDCPPSLSWLTVNSFTASDGVLIVVSPGYFELDSIAQISKLISKVQNLFNPGLEVAGLLFAMSDPSINSKTTLDALRATYPDLLLQTIIPRNTDIRDAHFNKKDIFTYRPMAKSAKAYRHLVKELGL